MNLADAAEEVLRKHAGKALHSKEIADQAIAAGLVSPRSESPGVYVAAAIRKDNRKRERQGESPRFEPIGEGRFRLLP
jgi:HB1, ASXL, restriction endonuclease HTH domain